MIIKAKKILQNNSKLYSFAKFLRNLLNHLENLIISILLFPVSPIPNKNFIIVTGSDSLHYKNLKQLLSSIMIHEKKTKVLVFDLGLKNIEKNELRKKFKKIEIRKFDYSRYPKYFNIKINAGEYAWKPVIISNTLNEFKCSIFWMDAGNVVSSRLNTIRKILNLTGFYSPFSDGKIYTWTHFKTLKFLKASNKIINKRNLSGGCVGVNYKFNNVKKVINRWKDCSLIKDCIAPNGSNKKNHRQDQAVLSVLAHQANIVNRLFKNFYNFKIHQRIN